MSDITVEQRTKHSNKQAKKLSGMYSDSVDVIIILVENENKIIPTIQKSNSVTAYENIISLL